MSDVADSDLLALLIAAQDLSRQLWSFQATVAAVIEAREKEPLTHSFAPPPFPVAELDEPPSSPA